MKRFNIYVAIFSLLLDVIAIAVGLILAYQIRAQGGELYAWPFRTYLKLIAVMLPVWAAFLASQGLYRVRNAPRGWNVLPRLITGLMAGWAVMIIIFYFWRNTAAENFPRLVIIYGIFLTTGLAFVGRLIVDLVIQLNYRFGRGLIKTAVISVAEQSRFIDAIKRERRSGRQLLKVLRTPNLDELRRLKTQGLNEIVVASTLTEDKLLALLNWAEEYGIGLVTVPSLMSVRATNIEAGSLGGTPVMYFKRSPLEGWGKVYKRLLDLIIVIPSIIILSPLLLISYILAAIATGSPIFIQERVGQDGRLFKVHKFRSMYVDGDERFPELKGWSADEDKDPRIPKLGRFLRKTNLNELAQLWDILIGTMSFVGPRPEQPKYVEKFAQEVPGYLHRHYVKSGLTGWAQINGARGNTPVSDRVKYDLYYIENWSLWFDIRIILATFVYVFRQLTRQN